MEILFIILAVLASAYLLVMMTGSAMVIYNEYSKIKEARKKRRDNYVVIQRKRYYPKRIGREVDCKVDCPLYKHCERGTKSICVVLNSPYDDTIMTSDDDD